MWNQTTAVVDPKQGFEYRRHHIETAGKVLPQWIEFTQRQVQRQIELAAPRAWAARGLVFRLARQRQLGIRHIRVSGAQLDPAQTAAGQTVIDIVKKRQDSGFFGQQIFEPAVQLGPTGRLPQAPRFFEQLIGHLRRKKGLKDARPRMQDVVREVVRVVVIRIPAAEQHVDIRGVAVTSEESRHIAVDDFAGDAQTLPGRFDGVEQGAVFAEENRVDQEAQGQKPKRPRRVPAFARLPAARSPFRIVAEHARRDQRGGRLCKTPQGAPHQIEIVEGRGQGSPQGGIAGIRAGGTEQREVDVFAGAFDQTRAETRLKQQGFEIGRQQVAAEIDTAPPQTHGDLFRRHTGLELDGVEPGRGSAPIGRHPLQPHPSTFEGGDAEGSAADQFFAALAIRPQANHRGAGIGQEHGEKRQRVVEPENQPMGSHGFDTRNLETAPGQVVLEANQHPEKAGRQAARREPGGPQHRRFDVFGQHRALVGKTGLRSQFDLINPAIAALLPARGEPGQQVAVGVEKSEGFVYERGDFGGFVGFEVAGIQARHRSGHGGHDFAAELPVGSSAGLRQRFDFGLEGHRPLAFATQTGGDRGQTQKILQRRSRGTRRQRTSPLQATGEPAFGGFRAARLPCDFGRQSGGGGRLGFGLEPPENFGGLLAAQQRSGRLPRRPVRPSQQRKQFGPRQETTILFLGQLEAATTGGYGLPRAEGR